MFQTLHPYHHAVHAVSCGVVIIYIKCKLFIKAVCFTSLQLAWVPTCGNTKLTAKSQWAHHHITFQHTREQTHTEKSHKPRTRDWHMIHTFFTGSAWFHFHIIWQIDFQVFIYTWLCFHTLFSCNWFIHFCICFLYMIHLFQCFFTCFLYFPKWFLCRIHLFSHDSFKLQCDFYSWFIFTCDSFKCWAYFQVIFQSDSITWFIY